MKYVMINGKQRCGKSYISVLIRNEILKKNPDTKILITGFADKVKEILATTFKCNIDDIDLYKNNPNKYRLQICDIQSQHQSYQKIIKDFSLREIIQQFATDAMQTIFGNDVWCDMIKIDNLYDYIIISDFRFLHEYENIKQNGNQIITIKIINNNITQQHISGITHISENDLENFKFDYIFDNTNYMLTNIDNIFVKFINEL